MIDRLGEHSAAPQRMSFSNIELDKASAKTTAWIDAGKEPHEAVERVHTAECRLWPELRRLDQGV